MMRELLGIFKSKVTLYNHYTSGIISEEKPEENYKTFKKGIVFKAYWNDDEDLRNEGYSIMLKHKTLGSIAFESLDDVKSVNWFDEIKESKNNDQ